MTDLRFREPSKSSQSGRRDSTDEPKLGDLLLKHADSFSRTTSLASKLNVKPGERGFLTWYYVSSSFPILAASLGPIANLGSIGALVSPWRIGPDGNSIADIHWVLALNAGSLFLGCIANISLFLNFSGRINYSFSQLVSIGGWYVASALLLSLTIATKYVYFHIPGIIRSQGFYYACITCTLYAMSATLLLINEIGHLRGQYSASFNLTQTQRRIMMQNVILMIWVGAGAGVFSNVIAIDYTDAIFYCVVTVTTIGLGDIVPVSSLARALCLAYAFVGVIILGLIVSAIRNLVLETNSTAAVFHRAERSRIKKYHRVVEVSETELVPPNETFNLIRRIHVREGQRGTTYGVYLSILTFCIFWLLGAMVFKLSEPWTYFECVYFCAMCLLTIGYGDFAPGPIGIGRPFFVVWAIGAIPMMTILISNLGDTLFSKISEGGDLLTTWLLAAYSVRKTYMDFWKSRMEKKAQIKAKEEEVRRERSIFPSSEQDMVDMVGRRTRNEEDISAMGVAISGKQGEGEESADDATNQMLALIREIQKLARTSVTNPGKTYSYEEWKRIMALVNHGSFNVDNAPKASYWLSDLSPLRFPIDETRFFLRKCLQSLEYEVIKLVEDADVDIDPPTD